MRNWLIVFQITEQSQQKCFRVSVSPHPHQHVVFRVTVILVNGKCYFIVMLNLIYSTAMCTPFSLEKCLFRFSAHFYLSSVSFYVCTRFLKTTPSSYHSLISYDLQIISSTPCLIYSLSSLCPLLHNLKLWWNQFVYLSFCYLSF